MRKVKEPSGPLNGAARRNADIGQAKHAIRSGSMSRRESTDLESAWYTVREVAQHFKISERQVRRWLAEGYLKSKHFGGSVRVSASELRRIEQISG